MTPWTRWVSRLVPRAWRDTVAGDLEEEARATERGPWWFAWQVGVAAWPLRAAILSDAAGADVRYALRSLRRSRWFTLGAVVTFALGFGANLATFAVVDRILFRPAPYPDGDRVVVLRACEPGTTRCYNNFPDAVLGGPGQTGFRTLGEFASASTVSAFGVSTPTGDPPPIRLVNASPNILRVLDVHAIRGRGPTDDEGREAASVAVLSYETWQRRFGGATDVIGRSFGRPPGSVRIIGILPAGFIPPSPGLLDPKWDGLVFRASAMLFTPIARLAPGATVAMAQAEISARVATLAPVLARSNRSHVFVRVDRIGAALFHMASSDAWLVVAVVGVLLLMASANLAALMLARGRSRERISALRTALGASAARVVATSLVEAFAVCLAGALVSWLALALTWRGIRSLLPPVFARYMVDALDGRVLVYTFGLAVVVALLTGAWPAWQATRVDVIAALGRAADAGRRSRAFGGRSLLVIESALAAAVVLTAILAIASFSMLTSEGVGYRADDLFLVNPIGSGRSTPDQSLANYRSMLTAAASVPGVVGVVGGDSVMTNGATAMWGFSNDPTQVGGRYELSAGALAVMGARLLAGREFTASEVASQASVAMLNEAGVALVAPGTTAHQLAGRPIALEGEPPRVVVGVLPTLRSQYGEPDTPKIYVPLGAKPRSYSEFLVRMAPGARPDVAAMGARLTAAAAILRVELFPVPDALDVSLVNPRFRAVLFGVVATCGLLLAAAGLYSLAAFEVSCRTREMGIRVALGASRRCVQTFVTAEVMRPVMIGAALGLVLAFWAAQFLRAFLYQFTGREPLLYVASTTILIAATAFAAWIPARRAARTDPAVVLRAE